jgi:DNA-binding NtrC family response regulator
MQDTPEPVVGAGERARIRPFAYRLRGEVAGAEVVLSLTDGLHRVGSGSGNDLILRHEAVSRRHALLLVEPGKVEVIDRASKNGTFVEGRRVQRAVLHNASRLAFGSLELELEAVDLDDALLALTLTPRPHEEPDTEETHRTTTATAGSSEPVSRWLAVVADCLETLQEMEATAGQALARVCSALEVEGAVFSSFTADEVEVLGAFGEVESSLLDRVRSLWLLASEGHGHDHGADHDHGATRRFFLSRPHTTGYIAPGTLDGSFGLILSGRFPYHEESLELLRTLLAAFVARHTRRLSTTAPSPRSARRGPLVFPPGYVVGRSEAARRLFEQVEHLVLDDLPVLIVGETGVGKELAARILHDSSPRRRAPLVAINCAAIPTELLEAELFGIGDRVATGVAGRRGKFREADGGTLFLDEISEMSAELQAKLLRVLQEGVIEPVGAPRARIDVRLLAATNTDVQSRVRDGRFRQDLFFRLAGYVLEVPPLRERREDIPLFVEHLIRTSSRSLGKSVRGISVRALRMLMEYEWPGNVRELENQIRRLVCLCPEGGSIDSALISVGEEPSRDEPDTLETTGGPSSSAAPAAGDEPAIRSRTDLDLREIEGEAICEALRRAGGNQVHAARLLGISRYALRRRMQRHRVSIENLL